MRGKIKEQHFDEDKYGYIKSSVERFAPQKRLDLNDLLKRMKNQKKDDKKINVYIISGAASVALVVFLVFSL